MNSSQMGVDGKEALCSELKAIVEKFAEDWEKKPMHWLQEIDVQCELACRIRKLFCDKKGISSIIKAKHSNYGKGRTIYTFSRVTCEPYANITHDYLHPDIVVWADDAAAINSGIKKMIWACEIKYTDDKPNSDEDERRLTQLVAEGRLFSGLVLSLIINRRKKGLAIPKDSSRTNGKIDILQRVGFPEKCACE